MLLMHLDLAYDTTDLYVLYCSIPIMSIPLSSQRFSKSGSQQSTLTTEQDVSLKHYVNHVFRMGVRLLHVLH